MRLAIEFSLLFMNVNPAQTIHKEPKSLTISSLISVIRVLETKFFNFIFHNISYLLISLIRKWNKKTKKKI